MTAPAPVSHVDLPRYMGAWYVLACVDNPVERRFVGATEAYTLVGRRDIHATFQWRDRSFDAPVKTHRFTGRVLDPGTNARWKMKLFPLFAASYLIVGLPPDYSWAAVAHPTRKFGWILARNPSLPESTHTHILEIFAARGYDPGKFIRIPHSPAAA